MDYMEIIVKEIEAQKQQELDDHDIRKWPESDIRALFDI